MKAINKRFISILLCLMLCLSMSAVITSAITSTEPKEACTHKYVHASHGNKTFSEENTSTKCYHYKWTQCVYRCSKCGDSIMDSHEEVEYHKWVMKQNPETGGYFWGCSKCGNPKENFK